MQFELLFRLIGALIYGFVGYELAVATQGSFDLTSQSALVIWGGALGGALLGFLLSPWLVIAPARAARNALRNVSTPDLIAGIMGLAAGLLIAILLAYPISRLPPPFGSILPFVVAVIFAYLGVALMVMRQRDFYRMFGMKAATDMSSRSVAEQAGDSPLLPLFLLDTSVIIDGRIADIAETGFLQGRLEVPRFVLNELQYIADSSNSMRRNRGRRGLEVLDSLQNNPGILIEFVDDDPEDAQEVDDKLVRLALEKGAAVMTNDYNLNRVAQLQGVQILNVNELANAVKSVMLPGEDMALKIIQEGKEHNQGVGYLEDGTMVVVENGRRYINQEVQVQVTKVLQTNAGRLIFATPDLA
ncbi:MAG: PIN domain nuclease [Caldilineaceae bacterium]|nr:PIN domain nuclease [Caldilineaceae bacterium]